VGEAVGGERGADLALPLQRRAPEQEAGALLGRAERGLRFGAGYGVASSASSASLIIVLGIPAVMRAPIWSATGAGASISTA
jgi:hypothetical protein